jgi:hypothetical protein
MPEKFLAKWCGTFRCEMSSGHLLPPVLGAGTLSFRATQSTMERSRGFGTAALLGRSSAKRRINLQQLREISMLIRSGRRHTQHTALLKSDAALCIYPPCVFTKSSCYFHINEPPTSIFCREYNIQQTNIRGGQTLDPQNL